MVSQDALSQAASGELDEVETSATGVTRTEGDNDNRNAAAERNNANVIGITTDSIEGIINNE
jgi:hypothetical protein